jgi:hypothetical protein
MESSVGEILSLLAIPTAATVYIADAPDEGGTNNAALYVASGTVFLNLPTSSGVTGSLWANSGVVTVS